MLFSGFDLVSFATVAITLVVAISVHEFSHAAAADWLGDTTPRHQGRLTLDPRRHLDPLGSIMLVIAGFGWGRPVYTNPRYFRGDARTGMAMVAAAGPISNLVLAIFAAFPVRLGMITDRTIASNVVVFISINVLLLVFNLIPVAPLDGFKVAVGFLPDEWAHIMIRLEQYGPMILMMLILSGRLGFNLLGMLMGPAHRAIVEILLGF